MDFTHGLEGDVPHLDFDYAYYPSDLSFQPYEQYQHQSNYQSSYQYPHVQSYSYTDLFSNTVQNPTTRPRANTNSSTSSSSFEITLGVSGKPYSYAQLITYAISTSKSGKLTLSEIYGWCIDNFPWFSQQLGQGWKNSIRHNLSLNKSFVKVARPINEPGKGSYWTLSTGSQTQYDSGTGWY